MKLIAKNIIAKNFKTKSGEIKVSFNAADESAPAEIMICDEIGKDPWSGEGVSLGDIKQVCDTITPRTRQLDFMTNSPGGLVNEGVAIRNYLNQWPGRITNTIIGIAASTASWCIPADEVRAYKSSEMFIHQAFGCFSVVGNADDIEKSAAEAAQYLRTENARIAKIYSEQTESTEEDMLALMQAETLLTGEQALEKGFVDKLIDGDAVNKFTSEQITAMKNKLAEIRNSISALPPQGERKTNNNQPQDNTVKREDKIALLNSWGIKVENSITDSDLDAMLAKGKPAATPPPADNKKQEGDDTASRLARLEADNKKLLELNNQAKKQRIETEINNLIVEDKVSEAEKEVAIELAMHNETGEKYLTSLKNRAPQRPGADPVGTAVVEMSGENLADVCNFVANNTYKLREKFLGKNAGNIAVDDKVVKDIASRAKAAANAIAKNQDKILQAWNTNTVDADLKRQVILQVPLLRAFKRRIIALNAFSAVFNNVPLEGTDKISVPYFPNQTAASTDFNGTYAMGDTQVDSRDITIDKRKYQGMSFTSSELRRLPYVNWAQLAEINGEKLGYDVFVDIVQNIITAAAYGASVKAVPAAAFTADDVVDLYSAAAALNWPDTGRSLVLNHTYKAALLKDPSFKQYLAYGSTDPVRKAAIQEAYGFEDIYTVPNLTAASPAGENLVGWINHKNAVLVATSPIMPTEDVRALLTRYDVITDSDTGMSVEYRRWGAPSTDNTNEVVECNYGRLAGVATALARITSA